MPSAVLVFTAKTTNQILAVGGSGDWKLNRGRVLNCEFLVCARNRNARWGSPTPEAHGSAFLVGRISDVVRAPESEDRWLIKISQYARVEVPGVWQKGWRFPVRYTSLENAGIHLDQLSLQPMPVSDHNSFQLPDPRPEGDEGKLLSRINVNPKIFGGKPIIRGRRLAVEHILGMLAAGDSQETLLAGYPWLEREDIQACLAYARRLVGHERVEPFVIEDGS